MWPYGPNVQASSSSSGAPWDYLEAFTLVDGQTDYAWGDGTSSSGDITGGADTTALLSMVQWGVTVLIPSTDYTILSDKIRLTSAPDASQAASGQPLIVRVRKAA